MCVCCSFFFLKKTYHCPCFFPPPFSFSFVVSVRKSTRFPTCVVLKIAPGGGKIRSGLWCLPTVSNHVNEECASVLVKQRVRLKKKTHARACWGAHPLAMTRMVVQRPNRALERRQAKVTVRPHSSQSCEECQKSFIGTGKPVAKYAH